MKRIFLLLLLIVMPVAIATDLADFPEIFIKDGNPDFVIILGKAANAEDVIGAISISVAMQHAIGVKTSLDIAKLDNEVKSLSAYNSIIIGGPCANAAAAKVLGYPKNCMEGFQAGKGIIKLFEFDNGKIAMLVAGALALDTRRTAMVVADYKSYNLTGTEVEITSINIKDSYIA